MRALIDARHGEPHPGRIVDVVGLHAWPWPTQDPILGLIDERQPDIYAGFRYAYSTLWVSTPLIGLNVVFSLMSILATRWHRPVTVSPSALSAAGSARISSSSSASSTNARGRPRSPLAQTARHPGSRAVRRHGDHRRHGIRQDVSLSLSVSGATLRVSRGRSRAQDGRPLPGGEGRLLPARPRHPGSVSTHRPLRRSQSRSEVPLQPCTTISRRMRSPMGSAR
jgi:hypothetical protein